MNRGWFIVQFIVAFPQTGHRQNAMSRGRFVFAFGDAVGRAWHLANARNLRYSLVSLTIP